MTSLHYYMLSLLVTVCNANPTPLSYNGWEIFWEDNFDTLNTSNWDWEITAWGGGNDEFQVYTPDPTNSYVEDGKLYIRPTLLTENINPLTGEPFGDEFLTSGVLDLEAMYGSCTMDINNGCYRDATVHGFLQPAASARLRTFERFSFTYGRIEIRAKMPKGDWLWPAMWLLPEDWVYGDWPRSGEIDIIELIGNERLINTENGEVIGHENMGATLHWGPTADENRYPLTTIHTYNFTHPYGSDFHHYLVDWDENGFRYYIDGEFLVSFPSPPINEDPDWEGWGVYGAPWEDTEENIWINATSMAPFDQDMHFVLNVAVGTTNGFMPDTCYNEKGGPKPWSNDDEWTVAMEKFYNDRHNWKPTWTQEDTALEVDYVRVWRRSSEDTFSITTGADCPGDNLELLRKTQLECKTACLNRFDCNAFVYVDTDDSEADTCFLKTDACSCPLETEDSNLYIKSTASSSTCNYSYETGDCDGNDIESQNSISLESCMDLCDNTEECAGFSYDTNNDVNNCYLKYTMCEETDDSTEVYSYTKLSES